MVRHLVGLLPTRWGNYFEPMLGGGALFFRLAPENAFLADINADLVNFYRVLKSDTDRLIDRLLRLQASNELYYEMRDWNPKNPLLRAIRFAYLNRLCWNGLYRVNRMGEFNVPKGDRNPKKLWQEDHLRRAATALQRAHLSVDDFRWVVRRARKEDFVFFDPPYPRGSRKNTGFNRYTADLFTLSDHVELARVVEELTARGVKVMLTIAGLKQLEQLYPQTMSRTLVRSKTLIACNGDGRRSINEVVLRNY